eukprot:3035261-Rhodomonas_salina.2
MVVPLHYRAAGGAAYLKSCGRRCFALDGAVGAGGGKESLLSTRRYLYWARRFEHTPGLQYPGYCTYSKLERYP